jgi:uncharacterized lipoprotein YajG
MISRSLVPLACLLALAGCGTSQVDIDNPTTKRLKRRLLGNYPLEYEK